MNQEANQVKTLSIVITDRAYNDLKTLKAFWRLSNLDSAIEQCIAAAMEQNKPQMATERKAEEVENQ